MISLIKRVPKWGKWALAGAAVVLVFRKAAVWAVIAGLSAVLHVTGVSIHVPKFAWPWTSITHGTTTNTDVGPWVLQRIEGISRPALGRANFNFLFNRKVSKNIGPWPCWYQETFYAVGYASATVDLNPGPAWWSEAGHYDLQVLSNPSDGKPGRVTVAMTLPMPQLPQSVHDITIDNTASRPVASDHSWTYPGFGCGVLIRPQFAQSVLYAEAQQLAYWKSTHLTSVTRPLISAAETEATTTIRDSFIQPTLNALGYDLTKFTVIWYGS